MDIGLRIYYNNIVQRHNNKDKMKKGETMMRKIISIFLSAAILLCFAACQTPAPQPEAAKLLEFPETNWSMTIQEVMDAYQITPESAGVTVLDDQSAFRIEGLTLFGVKTDNVLFAFQQADGKLSHVRLAYPDDADMQTVRQQLQTLYGDSVKRHTRLEYDLQEATMEETEHFAFWHSATPISGYLNAEDWAAFQRLAQKKDEEQNAGGAWSAFMEKEPLVVLTWQDDASYPDNMTVADDFPAIAKNKVVFNASILHYLPEFLASYK